jgi:anti-anti-sigma factor
MGELVPPDETATLKVSADPSGTPILKVTGELDLSSVGSIYSAIEAVIATGPDRIVFDLSELRFMDSSGLRIFLAVADQIAEVELLDPSPIVRKVIELTGTSGAFTLSP